MGVATHFSSGLAVGRSGLPPIALSQVFLIVASVLACSQVRAGLLRVPRVYNALITTHEKLVPSRAISVSAPLIQPLSFAPVLLTPPAAKNASEPEAANKTTSSPDTAAIPTFPITLYNSYSYYSPLIPYSYHAPSPFLLTSPLLHPYVHYPFVPALATAEKPADNAADQPAGSKDEPEKDSVSVESN